MNSQYSRGGGGGTAWNYREEEEDYSQPVTDYRSHASFNDMPLFRGAPAAERRNNHYDEYKQEDDEPSFDSNGDA